MEPLVGGGATYIHINHREANVIADTNPLVINIYLLVQAGQGQQMASLVERYPNTEPGSHCSRPFGFLLAFLVVW